MRFVAARNPSFQPTPNSKLCERHFTPGQYEKKTPDFAKRIGYKHRVILNLRKDAVPTIIDREQEESFANTDEIQNMDIDFVTNQTTPNAASTTTTTITETMVSPLSSLHWFADITAEASRIENDQFSIQTQTPYNLVARKSVGLQSKPLMKDASTQTSTTITLPEARPALNCSVLSSIYSMNSSRDTEWDLSEDECETSGDENEQTIEPKFIVYKSCLEGLLRQCEVCGANCSLKYKTTGTCVTYDIFCGSCSLKKEWTSQPLSGKMPFGNLILSAAILFAGASPLKCIRLLEFAGIATVSISTYNNMQSSYLSPAVRSLWQQNQLDLFQERQNKPLRIGGDGRCCSPGHTAKFGSYTMMDLESGHILDIQLVQSNEVANSYGMEKEGLIRSLDFLTKENNLQVSHLVTDRHSSVKKYMRENWPHIQHWFDVWHMAKGVHKKLVNAGKKKHCEKVGDWSRSISNHMYWCAASSNGHGELVKAKWLSILNHVINVHDGHGDRFPSCAHGEIEEERDWMIKDCKPYEELKKVVTNKLLLTDIQRLSPAEQTSSLEAFHKVICGFAPKSVHFFHAQMEARLYLAGLHFNANQNRRQKYSRSGAAQYRVSFPKGRSDGIAKEVKTDMNFEYVTDLMKEVLILREANETYRKANRARQLEEPERPVPVCHSTPHSNKRTIIERHVRRFNR